MIKQFSVKNYKALRDVKLDLTPIHVLIGPNDSGKTSILDALAALCRSTDHALPDAFMGSWSGAQLIWSNDPTLDAHFMIDTGEFRYELVCRFGPNVRAAISKGEAYWAKDGNLPNYSTASSCTGSA